jgi:glyoxylase-like metal-dependent hydrolase (beta-lactamase superfamily II)
VSRPGAILVELSPSLYWFRDTCNVYLVRSGTAGLLIDAGSGAVLDHLHEVGVEQVEWVLHTHHHRDQCQGDPRLIAHGASIAVPAREAGLFEHVDAFWRLRSTFDDYDVSSDWNSPAQSIAVARRLADHEVFGWRGLDLVVQPTPGHTRGSVTYLAELDGRGCAFSGDLIAAPGRVETIHDLQWQYGAPDALGAALHSTTLLSARAIDVLLPSHGAPIDEPPAALGALLANLEGLRGLLSEMRRNRVWLEWPHPTHQPKARLLPHLWANTHSLANTYALVSDDGQALLMDYGFPSWDHFFADRRFVEHSLAELREQAGIRSVAAVIPSHYHDDHLAGVPWLQATQGAEAWVYERFAEMLARPSDWKLPCLLGEPIRADRTIADGEQISFAGWSFEVFHMPGHTWWALGLVGEVDGVRVALTGDNLLAGALSPLRAAAPIYRNRMRLDSIATGVRRLMDREPELLLTGHTGAIEVTRGMLDEFLGWARQLEGAFTRLCAVPERVNEALDPDFVVCFPYLSKVGAGAVLELEIRVTEHGPQTEVAVVSLALPSGWSAVPAAATADVAPGEETALRFSVHVPAREPPGRRVLIADLTLGGRRYGQRAEAIVDVIPAAAAGTAPNGAIGGATRGL